MKPIPTILFFLITLCAASVDAAHVDLRKNIEWASYRDLRSSEFGQRFAEMSKQGYMITDVDGYPSGSSTRYAMIWQKNPDRRRWAEYRDMTSEQYNARWEELKTKGYRPVDIEVYRSGRAWRYAGIWIENKESLGWWSRRNMTSREYSEHFKQQRRRGYRPIDIEAYSINGALRFAAIWIENRDKAGWVQLRNLSRDSYQKQVNEQASKGLQVFDFEAYQHRGKMYYAAIWQKPPAGTGWAVRTGRTELQFANYWREYRDKGLRLIDFERYSTPSGVRYAGVWAENRPARHDYARKGQLDTQIEAYRTANSLPGISVAIIRNGTTIYQRGFGMADVAAGKQAHGQTVYYLASISKAVAGTLAARLERLGRIDLTRNTRSFLRNVRLANGNIATMPRLHTHTLEQLLSHTGCVRHYIDNSTTPPTPGIPTPSSGYYATDLDAAAQFWNLGLMPRCTVGRTYDYSTHAFTLIGAALEQATGRNVVNLFEQELFRPFDLSSMRFSYVDGRMASDYERARPYTYRSNGTLRPIGYQATSWKRLGGGMESSAVDLARFGWKVLNGEIVPSGPDTSRDGCRTIDGDVLNCRLWSLRPSSTRGLAWRPRTRSGRRVVEHGGDGAGFRTQLDIYRDDGTVIAILTNGKGPGSVQPNGSPVNLTRLGDQLANIVLR